MCDAGPEKDRDEAQEERRHEDRYERTQGRQSFHRARLTGAADRTPCEPVPPLVSCIGASTVKHSAFTSTIRSATADPGWVGFDRRLGTSGVSDDGITCA